MAAAMRFLRTPSVGRSVVALLSAAILLLLIVNVTTFVMIQRTAAFNDQEADLQATRRLARTVKIELLNAETGQRGFLLTGRANFLAPYNEAISEVDRTLAQLKQAASGDPELSERVAALERSAGAKLNEMRVTISLTSTGQIGQAIQRVRSGEGLVLMDRVRSEIGDIDLILSDRIDERTRRSEGSSIVTVLANALAGLLIIILAGVSGLLIRRYITELADARMDLDRVNAGLENTVRDRTAALTRANEEVQRFAYIVSHDLRSPLVNVMGFTSELEAAGKTIDRQMTVVETAAPGLVEADALTAVREDMPEAVAFIRASTEKMDRLINAILKLSRDGRRNLVTENLDVAPLLQAIADSVRHQTDAADAEIVVGDLPWIESDRLSLEQIFGNLIDNAVKYLDPARPGRIEITGADVAGGWVEYAITDNGRGIAPRDHERVFELFRRAGRQDRPGEGLGLAFVRNSVRRLGGSIDVESELGKGSTFRLKFPKRLILIEAGDTL